MELAIGLIAATLVGVLATMFHYECLSWLARLPVAPHRGHLLSVMLGLLAAHVLEIWFFACAYWFMIDAGWGTVILQGRPPVLVDDLANLAYYSAVVYTTLGFGDVVPGGPIRYLTGAEALMGLCLITWSASFAFLRMQKHWDG